ncbi:F-box domain,Leucine-rich repeat domain, L domain-like, partial [Cinara cedri]
ESKKQSEEHFIGFDSNDDNVTKQIELKIKLLRARLDEINKINEDNSVTNTVTCQGIECNTVMRDDRFYPQYVYEMNQARKPSMMVCVVQEPKSLSETSEFDNLPSEVISMQSFCDMGTSMKLVFSYLQMKDLLNVAKVCSYWNSIAMDKFIWQYVRLKNATVLDWDKFIHTIDMHRSISLDTRRMLLPKDINEFELFWSKFSLAIPNATQLRALELYRCPASVVEDVMCSLHQLEKLNATSIKNPYVTTDDATIVNQFMSVNLDNMGNMRNLTELQIKGITGIELVSKSKYTFSHMSKLKILSLTSIKAFPKDIFMNLGTVSFDLETLEIGDCEFLPDDFHRFIIKLTNLRSLRLENCCGRWKRIVKSTFNAIKSLKNLKILELINIDYNDSVQQELAKCHNIIELLIIPMYKS